MPEMQRTRQGRGSRGCAPPRAARPSSTISAGVRDAPRLAYFVTIGSVSPASGCARLRLALLLLLLSTDRGRRHLLGAAVLEHHQIIRRVFLAQAGAGSRLRGDRRIGGRGHRGGADTVDQRAPPAHVNVRAMGNAGGSAGDGSPPLKPPMEAGARFGGRGRERHADGGDGGKHQHAGLEHGSLLEFPVGNLSPPCWSHAAPRRV